MLKINDQNELLDYAIAVLGEKASIEEVQIGDKFNLHIKLIGSEWDGLIDYRVARYVLNLQKDIFSIYGLVSDEKISFKSPTDIIEHVKVKVHVENGSTDIWAYLGKAMTGMIGKTSGRQATFLLSLLIFSALSFFGYQNYNDTKVKLEKIKARVEEQVLDEKVKSQALEVADKALTQLGHIMRSPRQLAKDMADEDKLQFPEQNRTITKVQAVNISNLNNVDHQKESYCIDGNYFITSLNLKTWSVVLEIDNIHFTASTKQLSSTSIHNLHNIFEEAHNCGETPKMDLQVVAEIENSKIVNAYLTAIGKARPNATKLSNVLGVPREEFAEAKALPLFDGQDE